ncbi:amino acid permease [Paludibacterium purpuratum]|uniref:Lysine:proton symporter (AAT family) n=1 Tax=Paludibacterium purpuratum TaxID=1144873 RepID=A0A4R7B385_9NEIS|nr:amino acid permease [Paludibacterium purpuratum]TDR76634.1 lysine:proton symporter (AAT family) [Paludibacterium purpuratum]
MQEHQDTTGLRRALRARHLSMIAIGGSIGTGLFLASGATIATAGPAGALLAYAVCGLMVYFLMTSLGEMAAYMPQTGSFQTYGSTFVDQGFGFALGWNYWFNWAIVIAVELVAAGLIMHYWFPNTPGWVWSALSLALIVALNIVSVRGFGEAEYWFSLLKVITIIAFVAIGMLMIVGIMTRPVYHGLAAGLPVFFASGNGFVGGMSAFISVSMVVGFAYQGTEVIGVAAGEAEDPAKSLPRAARQIFWRILMFYMLSILVVGLLLPYNDPLLLKNDMSDVGASPFTLVFQRAGMAAAASVVNATILSAVLSAGNSGIYACTRMLYSMAQNGMAPASLGRLSKNGVPRNALYLTTAVAALCFLTSLFGDSKVYMWLLNCAGMTGFIAWLGIAVCHYRFRRALIAQGRDLAVLPYRAKWFPLGPLFAFALCLLIMLGQNIGAFTGAKIDWNGVLATYIGIPLFMAFWLGYKWKHRQRLIPLREIDFSSARADLRG